MNLSNLTTAGLGLSSLFGGSAPPGGGNALQGMDDGPLAHVRIGVVVHGQDGGPAAGNDDPHAPLMQALQQMDIGPQQPPSLLDRLSAAQNQNAELRQVLGGLLGGQGTQQPAGNDAGALGLPTGRDAMLGVDQSLGLPSPGGLVHALEDTVKALEQQNEEMFKLVAALAAAEAEQADASDDASAGAPAPQAAAAQVPDTEPAMPSAAPPAATGGAQAPAAGGGAGDAQTVLNGDATSLASNDEKCPDNVSMDQLMNADGGLLKNLGNQTLKGDGAKGITGGIEDNLAKKAGGTGAGDIGTNKDVTYRALKDLEAFKNEKGANGQDVPDSVRHNGNVSGLQPSHEVARGSTLGEMQDWFKGAIQGPERQLPKGDKVDDNGVETSGAQQVGQKILKGLSDIAGFFKKVVDDTIGKIPGIGKILSAPMDLIAGGASDGLKAASDAADGHMIDARQDGKNMAHGLLKTLSDASSQASGLLKETVGRIPGIGKLLAAAGEVGANLEQGALKVADTALEGGNVGDAAKNMGKNLAGAVVGAGIGIVDPTGLVSGAAEQGVDSLVGAQSQQIA